MSERECSKLERTQHFGAERGHGDYVVQVSYFTDEKINISRGKNVSYLVSGGSENSF